MRTVILHFRWASTVAWLLVGSAFAQTPEDGLRSRIATVHYALLAEQARIQGDVRVHLNSGVATLLFGHPLLAQTAVESAKAIGSIGSETNLDLTYHFVLADTTVSVRTPTTVKRGNAFERAVLRMFGRKTEKVVLEYECQEGLPPPNVGKVVGSVVEIWIYGRTHCLQTEGAALLARR
jgi:hypothetical protein